MYRLDHMLKKWVGNTFGKSASVGIGGIYRRIDDDPTDDPTDDQYMGDYAYQVTTSLIFKF
jgi:hypothetical protein